jgi:hypothetical protein
MDTRASNKHRPAGPPSIVQAHAQARASIAIDFHRFPSISTTAARSTDRIKRVTRFPVMVVAPGRRSAHYVNSLASLFFFFFCFLFSFVPPCPPPRPMLRSSLPRPYGHYGIPWSQGKVRRPLCPNGTLPFPPAAPHWTEARDTNTVIIASEHRTGEFLNGPFNAIISGYRAYHLPISRLARLHRGRVEAVRRKSDMHILDSPLEGSKILRVHSMLLGEASGRSCRARQVKGRRSLNSIRSVRRSVMSAAVSSESTRLPKIRPTPRHFRPETGSVLSKPFSRSAEGNKALFAFMASNYRGRWVGGK